MSDDTDVENTFIVDKDQSISAPPKKADLWGRFVSTSTDFKNVDFSQDEIWFGRGKDLPEESRFADKRMSSKHFRVFLESGQAFVEDNSSNGTYLNGKKLAKGVKELLKNGDEVSFFSPKPESGVPAFVFQDKRKKGDKSSIIITPPPAPSQDATGGKRKLDDTTDAPAAQPPAKKVAVVQEEEDEMEKNFTCGICQDIIYKCVSLIPCLHSFCCSCLSDWLERSNDCPECRKSVKGVNKPHLIQNMIDTYLAKNPHKKRSAEEMAALDPKSDINKLMENFKNNHGGSDDNDDDEDEEDEDDDKCRQCPPGDGSGFVCRPHQRHIYCSACDGPMPGRQGPGIIQRCDVCFQPYCNAYWGCKAPNAANTFKKLGDFDLNQVPAGPQGAFGGNDVERQILVDYLRAKGITPTACFKTCVAKLESGEFKYTGVSMVPNLNPQSHTCQDCANKIFAELLFDYTKAIPKADLPGTAGSRPDCYYGKNCRTQGHNVQHRQKFNHVCDQTKF